MREGKGVDDLQPALLKLYGTAEYAKDTLNGKELLVVFNEDYPPQPSAATGISWFGFWVSLAAVAVAKIIS